MLQRYPGLLSGPNQQSGAIRQPHLHQFYRSHAQLKDPAEELAALKSQFFDLRSKIKEQLDDPDVLKSMVGMDSRGPSGEDWLPHSEVLAKDEDEGPNAEEEEAEEKVEAAEEATPQAPFPADQMSNAPTPPLAAISPVRVQPVQRVRTSPMASFVAPTHVPEPADDEDLFKSFASIRNSLRGLD